MTEQEKINQTLQRQIDAQGSRIDLVATRVDALNGKIDAFIDESRVARNRQDENIRDRDNQRATEIMEIRQDMRNMQASLDTKIDGIGKHVQNLTVAAMVGVGTSVIAVVVMVGTVVYSMLTR